MFNHILDRITMYRLTIYYLAGLLIVAFIAGWFGFLSYSPIDILITTSEVVGGVLLANQIMADLLHAHTNIESSIITALILAFLITPKFPLSFQAIAIAGAFAILSKYLATVTEHHVFNPVAAGLVALSLLSDSVPTWWVGTPVMLPFVVIGGYLVVKKVNREKMVIQFLAVSLALIGIFAFVRTGTIGAIFSTWWISLTHSALLFFATIMLTEPATSPGTEHKRSSFAVITALLYTTPQLPLGVALTPEMALCLANVFSFIVSPQYRYILTLTAKKLIARDTYEFTFTSSEKLHFIPGQYMEWTLPHEHIDDRGNRRYFSLSSTPSEAPAFAVKYYEPPSSYKRNLLTLPVGGTISATNLAGDFTLRETKKPLVFIAGGIGIAPFRSIIAAIIEQGIKVDITLLYINTVAEEVCYPDLWKAAEAYGVKTHLVMTEVSGHLTPAMMMQLAPRYETATYYVSGPQRLVEAAEAVLRTLHIPRKQVVTDFFPGY